MICVVVATKKKRQTCRLQKTSKCKETLKKKMAENPVFGLGNKNRISWRFLIASTLKATSGAVYNSGSIFVSGVGVTEKVLGHSTGLANGINFQ